jgi:hypothetical protein
MARPADEKSRSHAAITPLHSLAESFGLMERLKLAELHDKTLLGRGAVMAGFDAAEVRSTAHFAKLRVLPGRIREAARDLLRRGGRPATRPSSTAHHLGATRACRNWIIPSTIAPSPSRAAGASAWVRRRSISATPSLDRRSALKRSPTGSGWSASCSTI